MKERRKRGKKAARKNKNKKKINDGIKEERKKNMKQKGGSN